MAPTSMAQEVGSLKLQGGCRKLKI